MEREKSKMIRGMPSGRRKRPTLRYIAEDARGMALVLTLSVLAIIVAMVIEFSYAVYISTHSLYNWQDSQKLSPVAKSGVRLAAMTISQNVQQHAYTYPGISEVLHKDLFRDLEGSLSLAVRMEDENSKFNVSSLIYPNGILNQEAFSSCKRLLDALGLSTEIADRIADWIDPDQEPRLSDSEKGAKNQNLDSVDELLLIPRMDRESYEKLSPYITIYGGGLINVNGAEVPVLMSLSNSVTKDMAQRIVRSRQNVPFEKTEDVSKVAGLEKIGPSLMGRLTVKGTAFRLVSTATDKEIRRMIESVVEISEGKPIIRYWREI
jgi:general secretion pathway protein K